MNKKFLEKTQQIIDSRKFDAENKALDNKTKALKNEKFNNLFNQYINLMLSETKNGISNSNELKNLKSKVDKSLKVLELFPIEPDYFCKKCNDSGKINGKYCDCFKSELNKLLIKESGFSKLEDFDNVKYDIYQNQKEMFCLFNKMKEWCHSKFDKNIVVLGGETGVGKTFLMKCMANELIKLNKVVLLTSSFNMNQDFLKSYSSRDMEEKSNLLDKYLDSEILFIDDLGTELRQPNITVKYLYLILNERSINKKPTIITTNLTLEEINDYYDERISSRLANQQTSICVFIHGKDLRLKR